MVLLTFGCDLTTQSTPIDPSAQPDSTQKNSHIWSVYLIKTKLNTLYCGISTDVERRFLEHLDGAPKGAKALRGKSPLEMVFHQSIGNKSQASKIEIRIKKLSRKDKDLIVSKHLLLDDLFYDILNPPDNDINHDSDDEILETL